MGPAAILEAVRNPLKTHPIKIDDEGLLSRRIVGTLVEVVLNPDLGLILPINPTSTRRCCTKGWLYGPVPGSFRA